VEWRANPARRYSAEALASFPSPSAIRLTDAPRETDHAIALFVEQRHDRPQLRHDIAAHLFSEHW